MLAQYAKAIASIIAAALAVLVTAVTDGVLTPLETGTLAIAVVTAIGVYLIPNLDAGVQQYAKGVVAFVGAGLAALVVILSGVLGWADVSLSDWLTVILAALGGVGVVVVPNAVDGDFPKHAA